VIMSETSPRRLFLKKCMSAAMMLTGGILLLNSCGAPGKEAAQDKPEEGRADSCDDYAGLTENDLKARASMGYSKQSPIPGKQCNNCNLWLPPAGNAVCGKCQLFKGPVYAAGHCTYWAPQV
ncbi:MAG TPA: high-potential iron-sulfur protein, partial [Agriterribacter sp.]|nr:high-potential iron-sulfur protein [Agriterribacter sp.]